jgi:hypothetical protein
MQRRCQGVVFVKASRHIRSRRDRGGLILAGFYKDDVPPGHGDGVASIPRKPISPPIGHHRHHALCPVRDMIFIETIPPPRNPPSRRDEIFPCSLRHHLRHTRRFRNLSVPLSDRRGVAEGRGEVTNLRPACIKSCRIRRIQRRNGDRERACIFGPAGTGAVLFWLVSIKIMSLRDISMALIHISVALISPMVAQHRTVIPSLYSAACLFHTHRSRHRPVVVITVPYVPLGTCYL